MTEAEAPKKTKLRSSFGPQHLSRRTSEPAHSVPKGPRTHVRLAAHAPRPARRRARRPTRARPTRPVAQPNLFISAEHCKRTQAADMPGPTLVYSSFGTAGKAISRADGRHLKSASFKFATSKRFDERALSIGPGPAAYAN